MARCTSWLQARLRPAGFGAAAFAHFATIDLRVACRAVAREASEGWWSQAGSNRRPLACHASALPAELWPLNLIPRALGDARDKTLNTVQGRSQVSSSPPTSPMMSVTSSSPSSSSAMKVESSSSSSSMVSSTSMSSSDFGNHGLDLAGILLGVGFLERHQFFGLGGLRRLGGGSGGSRSRGARGGVGAGPGRRNRRNRHDLAGVG